MATTAETIGTCDVCGNTYDDVLTITQADRTGVFDSFECAIHAFAPSCGHCGCKVIGHGVQSGGAIFCCAHCAQRQGEERAADRF